MQKHVRTVLAVVLVILTGRLAASADERSRGSRDISPSEQADRSPADLALSPDQRWLVTVNETSSSVSLIRTSDRHVVHEVSCGRHPADVEFHTDSRTLLVSGAWSGDVTLLKIDGDSA